ncbi:MAG: hypothetical protein WCK59_04125 [Candidatus Falkowbacteria bacterium]
MDSEIKANSRDLDLMDQQNKLLQHNLELSQEILEKTEAIRIYIKWQKIWSTVRMLIIIIPLVIGFIYLPPLIKDYLTKISSLYNK